MATKLIQLRISKHGEGNLSLDEKDRHWLQVVKPGLVATLDQARFYRAVVDHIDELTKSGKQIVFAYRGDVESDSN
jgi:hypothetical protein